MILDLLVHANSYDKLGSGFAAGLAWLAKFDPQTADGRYEIDGDNVYALVQSYDTAAPSEKKYESHRVYADIQYVAAGSELILYAPTAQLQAATAYDGTKDFLLYADPASTTPLLLGPGRFAVFLPQDGHKPGCIDGAACRMKKVVIKVRV
jgi:YhcH/YjgK/YiaL family protein